MIRLTRVRMNLSMAKTEKGGAAMRPLRQVDGIEAYLPLMSTP
jgi:hypothetical protein